MSALPPIPAVHALPTEQHQVSVHVGAHVASQVSTQARQIARDIVRGLSREKPAPADPSNLHPTFGPVHRMRRSSANDQGGKSAFLEGLASHVHGKAAETAAGSVQDLRQQGMPGNMQRVASPERIAQRQAAVRERSINAMRFEIQPATFVKAASQLKTISRTRSENQRIRDAAGAIIAQLEGLARRAYYYDQALRVQLHNDPRPWWFRAMHIQEESLDEWMFRVANTEEENPLENTPPKTFLVIYLARLDSRAPTGMSTRTVDIDLDSLPFPPVPDAGYNDQATQYGLQLLIPVKTDAGVPVASDPLVPLAIDYDVHLADQTHLPLWPFDQEGRFNPAHDGQPGTDNAPWVRPAKALDWQFLLDQSFGRQRLWAQHACANHAFEHGLAALRRHLGQAIASPAGQLAIISSAHDYAHHKFLELQRHKAEQHILPHSHFERLIALECRWGAERKALKEELVQAAGRAHSGWLGAGDRLQSVEPAGQA